MMMRRRRCSDVTPDLEPYGNSATGVCDVRLHLRAMPRSTANGPPLWTVRSKTQERPWPG